MLLNYDIADIKKPNGICSPTFVVEKFSGLFLHPSIFSIKHLRSNKWYFIGFLILIKL